ncbi:MAG: filamentous hemagglutinin N-terminal domain-containing protein [Thiotrichaceae bacterium]
MRYLIFYLLSLLCQIATAEIVLDGSLGERANLTGPNYAIDATLGTQLGNNLFHSFQEFNLSKDETATFSGATTINNVIGRITGGNPSYIDGTLRNTIPNANLYLINPSGLMFGVNAKLDVQGSFYASTADVLRFDDGGNFHATTSQDSLLSSAPPSAFGFLGTVATLQLDGSQLKVPAGKDISLVGGDLTVQANVAAKQVGALNTVGGEINLASVTQGDISIGQGWNLSGQGGTLTVRSSQLNNTADKSGNIYIRAGKFVLDNSSIATLTASQNGGTLDIQGDSVEISGGSRISSTSLKNGKSGDITIQAAESIYIHGQDTTGAGVTLAANARGTDATAGNAGNITLKAKKLVMDDGTKLGSASYGGGNGGTISLETTDSITLQGEDKQTTSSIYLVATGSGQGGKLNVQTGKLQTA